MLFNSFPFVVFFTAFFFLYWFVCNRSLKLQNLLLLAGCYVFCYFAGWQSLLILIAVSAINFVLGILIEKNDRYKKLWLWLGLLQGIGLLIYFKYFNFFIGSFQALFEKLHINMHVQLLNIFVPVGISFFTFRTLSYLLDINKGKIKASKDWVEFFTYVAFFPALLAGPIDRAKTFLPQLETKRIFDYSLAVDGMRQILWGTFKKMVIADNCAIISQEIFSNYQQLSGSTLFVGAFFYSVQIYADFSGYSDIAIGVSKLLGFNITRNFNYPYFSQNIAEFWRKWHISLTSWLTEYLFTPLNIAFRNWGNFGIALAIIINFTIIGMWHGANWTYVLFGLIHGLYFIPLIIKGTVNKKKEIAKGKMFPSLKEMMFVLLNCFFVMLTFVLFRSDDVTSAVQYLSKMFSRSLLSVPDFVHRRVATTTLVFLAVMFAAEWFKRNKEFALQIDDVKRSWMRTLIYWLIILSIIIFRATETNQFIYFQF